MNAVGARMGGAARHLPPFLHALTHVRPSWTIDVFLSRDSVDLRATDGVRIHQVTRLGRGQRVRWDCFEVNDAAMQVRADALINLTNNGPLKPSVPSLLYQRNALYFDTSWLPGRPLAERTEARLRRILAFRQMNASRVTIVPSFAMAAMLRSWAALPDDAELHVIPHGVNAQQFAFAPRRWAGGSLEILSASHAAPHKDFETAVAVLSHLRSDGIDARLTLTAARGDSPAYFTRLERLIDQVGVRDHVALTGRVADVERLFASADLFLSTSLTESFGFPVLEAMAAGVPIVASGINAAVEVLEGTGELFGPGNSRQAAEACLRSLNSPRPEQEARLHQARSIAESNSWTRNATRTAQLVERVFACE